jgi:hypothetical protein
MFSGNGVIISFQRRNRILPISDGGHGMEKGHIFITQLGPSSRATLLPVILLTKKQILKFIFYNILKVPFRDMKNALLLNIIQHQNDLIAVINQHLQH